MRMIGQGLGPGFTTVATRRSVILSVEGLELVLTALGYASSDWSINSAPPSAPIEVFRTSRRFMKGWSFLTSPKQVNAGSGSVQQVSLEISVYLQKSQADVG